MLQANVKNKLSKLFLVALFLGCAVGCSSKEISDSINNETTAYLRKNQ